jgi:hypothetical protein
VATIKSLAINNFFPGWLDGSGPDNDMWKIVNHTLFNKQLPTDSQGIYMVRCLHPGRGASWEYMDSMENEK